MTPPSPPPRLLRTPQGIYVLEHDSHLSRWIEEHGRLDIAEPQIAHYAKYIPVGGTVVDAGASLGDHALTYAKLVGPSGRVFAFEPSPLAFEALVMNFLKWNTVEPYRIALGSIRASGSFHPSLNAGAGYVTDESGDILIRPLDEYANSFNRLDFIHLDCEGMERAAILGAREVIVKFQPVIVLEINHACLARYGLIEEDVLLVLQNIGYRWHELEPGLGPHLPQRDIIALPHSSATP